MPEQSEEQYFAMLRSGKPFFYLRRRASPALVEAVNALGEPGLAIQREPDRLYPQTSLAAHVLGLPTSTVMAPPVSSGRSISTSPIPRPAASRWCCPSPARSSKRWSTSWVTPWHILGDRCGGRGHGRPHGRSPGNDLAAGDQSQRAGPGHAGRAVQPRDAGRLRTGLDVQAVHASRWRWTAASSRASARSTIAPTCSPSTATRSTTRILSAAYARSPRS